MPRRASVPDQPQAPPSLANSLHGLTVDELKWFATVLPGKVPLKKADLVNMIASALTSPASLQGILVGLSERQKLVLAEVAHNGTGVYDKDTIEAKYPDVPAPSPAQPYFSSYYQSVYQGRNKKRTATAFDLFFTNSYEWGQYIPPDLAALLRTYLPKPPTTTIASGPNPPVLVPHPNIPQQDLPELFVSDVERSVFHDLAATLHLIAAGKVSVGASTRLPTLPTVKGLRQHLLVGDYFPDEYERAEDAVRPLALAVLVQAAKWAVPKAVGGSKLELTRSGQALLAGPLGEAHVKEAWERWLKSDLLDELSRVRGIKGQQSRDVRLTKPSERRERLVEALRVLPVGQWVLFDELLRYMRAEGLMPLIERNSPSALRVGAYAYYDSYGHSKARYWDVITGSWLRAALWEYSATLGLVEIAYTYAEDTPHDFGLYELDDEGLGRYDGLLGLRLSNLGAYVLGMAGEYTPPVPVQKEKAAPILRVLPNLDVVVTDAARALPNERAFLERIGTAQSQDVYRLSRETLLDAAGSGLDLARVKNFLAEKSGVPEDEFPQTVQVFFSDLQRRLGLLREGGKMVVLEGDDPLVLTELAHTSTLR